jgi:O-antigen/teichoic acid export membrane protein
VDQGVSSLSNFLLGVIAARTLGAEGFGAFSLVYLTSAFVLSATRGVATDPLLVRFSGPMDGRWRAATAAATATAATSGVAAGLLIALLAPVLPTSLEGGFWALALTLPGLLLQDSCRFAFFSAGRPSGAVLNDAVWGGLLLLALGALVISDQASVPSVVLAFGTTATLAGVLGLIQLRMAPRWRATRTWLAEQRSLGGRYLVENLSIGAARQVRFFALGAVAGLAAVGDTRAAEILMGPFLVILMGASQVAVPEASHVLRESPRRLLRFCTALGAVLATASALWGTSILLLLPTGVGDLALGELWVAASDLVPIVMIGMVFGGFEIAAAAGVRALGAAPRSLFAQLVNAVLYVTGGTVGALVDGARGSCWGVAVATALGTAVWWVQLRRGIAEFAPSMSEPSTASNQPTGVRHE